MSFSENRFPLFRDILWDLCAGGDGSRSARSNIKEALTFGWNKLTIVTLPFRAQIGNFIIIGGGERVPA
jgi:hypothetical protein